MVLKTCYRYIWSTLTPLLWHQPSRCTTLQTLYRRQPSFSGCRRQDLERIAGPADSLVSITSPSSFRHHLKIFLFQRSFS